MAETIKTALRLIVADVRSWNRPYEPPARDPRGIGRHFANVGVRLSAAVSTRGEPHFVRGQDEDPFFQEPNASHLRRAIADMEAGRNIVEHDLVEA